ncbi:ribbon-helix-helix domain-containing protein [Devosia rhodophyticola]|uniref:Ribbon-helix-helix domain-containing protein n=1 Tax=Devosia rhodophyticola TaxID=3026423 RepID=A0ABY7YVX3_9HYPH|nr:ribbon-helix-helix domain-containing protein [Devosia rhodophyticola]WDR05352.1 ribbon-helix-helix domain-containing protein [Devosia rhodophyticola]
MEKRSLSIAGHRTSIALEPEFWAVLEAMAAADSVALPRLVKTIDETRTVANLASALRLAALRWTADQSAQPTANPDQP